MGDRVLRGPALAARLEQLYGRSSRALSPTRQAALLSTLKRAAKATQAGEWARAAPMLLEVRKHLGRDVLSQSQKPHLFRALKKTRILLSICYLRMRQRKRAWEMMEEAMVAQPGMAIPAVLYGPLLQRLYFQVKTTLDLQRGALSIQTNPAGALVFLSGRSAGFSPVTVKGLYQGTYDVLVVWRDRASRVRRVTVGPRPTVAHFDRDLETPFRTTPYAGLYLPEGPRRRALETHLALQMGAKLGAGRILLVGLRKKGEQEAIVGEVLHLKRRSRIAQAYVVIDRSEPSSVTLQRLASFLLYGGVPGRGVIVVGKGHSAALSAAPGAPRRRRLSGLAIAGWTTVATGLAVGIGGGVALGLDGRVFDHESGRAIYTTKKLGIGLIIGGLGAAAFGVTFLIVDYVRQRRPGGSGRAGTRIPRLFLTTDGRRALVGVSGRF